MPRMKPFFFASFARLGNPFQSMLSWASFRCAANSPES